MKKLIFTLTLLSNILFAQEKSFNFDFEEFDQQSNLPKNWSVWGYSNINYVDDSFSGKKAIQLSSKENVDFGSIVFSIPNNYTGNKIKIEGYIKTKDVEEFAGLIIRQDSNEGTPISIINTQKTPAKGTTEWTKYSVETDLSPNSRFLQFAIILSGKGTATFDKLNVFIDDKNIQSIKVEDYKINPLYKNSGISNISSNQQTVENIEVLAKIWGFLKYYHPSIASGKYNWDYELFKFLPKYIQLNNKDRDIALINWFSSFGTIKKCNSCPSTSKYAKITVNHQWISNSNLSKELQNQLQYIYTNRLIKNHHYVKLDSNVGNPVFTNENTYTNFSYPDQGYQLLTLFKYWNIINYFFPYTYLTDKKWENVLKEFIPKFLESKNEIDFEKTTIELFSNINDSHSFVMSGDDKIREEQGRKLLPLEFKFIDGKLIITDISRLTSLNSSIKPGDEVSKINGKTIQELEKDQQKLIRASNKDGYYRNLASILLRTKEVDNRLEINQQNVIINSISSEEYYKKEMKKSYQLLTDDIGYIDLEYITLKDVKEIPNTLFDTKGIIIDIRNYPNESVFRELAQIFSDELNPFVKFTLPNLENIGEFIFMKNAINNSRSNYKYKGKIVVLVNEKTQSNAEFTVMALQATGKVTVIGSQTAGADGNISYLDLPGGFRTSFTGLGVYYPNGEETQRIGISIDHIIKPTINGLKNRKDEVLEKAIELIKQN